MNVTMVVKAVTLITVSSVTFFTCASNAKISSAPTKNEETWTATPSGGIKYVAVVETEMDAQSGASAGLNPAEVRQITTVLRREAVKNLPQGKYNIMTSETIQAQGGATLEECADENCVITLGSKIGADYIVRGIISKFGTKFTVSVEMYETENGMLVVSSDLVSSENTAELLEKAAAACAGMYKTFESGRGSEQRKASTSQTQVYQQSSSYQQSGGGGSGAFTDSRDGKTYRTVVIGGKRWMAENLNYKNRNSYNGKYGRLYKWSAAMSACPTGWHLPTRQDWNHLGQAVGGNENKHNIGGHDLVTWGGGAATKLKSRIDWIKKKKNLKSPIQQNVIIGTDDFGFSALPDGAYPLPLGLMFVFSAGAWWTSNELNNESVFFRAMYANSDILDEGIIFKNKGKLAVRCVCDD